MSLTNEVAAGRTPHDDENLTLQPQVYTGGRMPSTGSEVPLSIASALCNEAISLWESLEVNPWGEHFLTYRLEGFQRKVGTLLHEAAELYGARP